MAVAGGLCGHGRRLFLWSLQDPGAAARRSTDPTTDDGLAPSRRRERAPRGLTFVTKPCTPGASGLEGLGRDVKRVGHGIRRAFAARQEGVCAGEPRRGYLYHHPACPAGLATLLCLDVWQWLSKSNRDSRLVLSCVIPDRTLVSGQSDLGALRTFMLYTNTVVVRNSGAGEVQNIETDAKPRHAYQRSE